MTEVAQMNGYVPSFAPPAQKSDITQEDDWQSNNNTKNAYNQNSTSDANHKPDAPMEEPSSDLSPEERALLNSFRKDSTDERWDRDEEDEADFGARSPSRQEDMDDLYDDYGYTADQRQALMELDNMKLDLGYVEEDPPEYDVAERVRQLNAELAQEPEPDEDRTRSIKFKDNLIDLVAPPPDYPSSTEEEDEGARKKDRKGVKINDQSSNTAKPNGVDTKQGNNTNEQMSVDSKTGTDNTNGVNTGGRSTPNAEEAEQEYENDFEEDTPSASPADSQTRSESEPTGNKDSSAASPTHNTKSNSADNSSISNKNSPSKGKEEKVLIERDGKFELVSVSELKSQGLYPFPDVEESSDDPTHAAKGGDDEEKMLVERNGKFEMVSVAELKAQGLYPFPELSDDLPEESPKSVDSQGSGEYTPAPPRDPRPSTAAGTQRRSSAKVAPRRVQSAKYGTHREGTSIGLYDEFNYTSPYALTPEVKREMRKEYQQEMNEKRKQMTEEEKKEEERRRENNEAFQFWLKTKKKEAYNRRQDEKQHNESQQKDDEERKKSRGSDGAFEDWLKVKLRQRQREKLVDKERTKELSESWQLRPREDCDKAFKQWLKKKNQDTRKEQRESKSKQRISKLMVRRTRKAMALAKALRQSQSFRYVDYYGYRY